MTHRDHLHKYVEAVVKNGLARGLFHKQAPIESVLAYVFEQAKRDIIEDGRVVVEAVLRDVVGGLLDAGLHAGFHRVEALIDDFRRGGGKK